MRQTLRMYRQKQQQSITGGVEFEKKIQDEDESMRQTRMEFYDQMGSIKFVYKIQNGHLNYLLNCKKEENINDICLRVYT